jgi:hypothetical protein
LALRNLLGQLQKKGDPKPSQEMDHPQMGNKGRTPIKDILSETNLMSNFSSKKSSGRRCSSPPPQLKGFNEMESYRLALIFMYR